VRIVGVEPATNIAEIARANSIETLTRFFDSQTARLVRESFGPAKLVIANNVLAHVDGVGDFLNGCSHLLDTDGLVVIEVPYLRELLDRLEYDTIYHEHLSYFSVSTLLRLCDTVGLSIVRVDQVPVHGGSLRIYAGLPNHYQGHAQSVLAMAAEERREQLTEFANYERFAKAVRQNASNIRELLKTLNDSGKTVAGYGAPAKGNTLLNYCQIDTTLLAYTVDKNQLKLGLYTPGMHIPVLPVFTLLEKQPDYVLILAWNFAEEIARQQAKYLAHGGHFIIPLPEPTIL